MRHYQRLFNRYTGIGFHQSVDDFGRGTQFNHTHVGKIRGHGESDHARSHQAAGIPRGFDDEPVRVAYQIANGKVAAAAAHVAAIYIGGQAKEMGHGSGHWRLVGIGDNTGYVCRAQCEVNSLADASSYSNGLAQRTPEGIIGDRGGLQGVSAAQQPTQLDGAAGGHAGLNLVTGFVDVDNGRYRRYPIWLKHDAGDRGIGQSQRTHVYLAAGHQQRIGQ